MKKLILSAAILLGSFSAFAQTTPKDENSTPKGTATESTMPQPPATQSPTTQSPENLGTISPQADGYTEITNEELPVAVTDALKKSFPDAKLVKVNINGQKQYKLDVEVGSRVGSLYVDETGKWIQK